MLPKLTRRNRLRLITLAGLAGLVFVAAACGGSGLSDSELHSQINTDPIGALAGSAQDDAQQMMRHADAMTAASAQRPDARRWAADAETIRANARTLSFMAEGARSISRDPGSHPGTAVEVTRIYGDGDNLRVFGQMLIADADAMRSHIVVMREEAAGDAQLLQAVEAFAPNVEAMKTDGQAAIDRGNELIREAQRIASSIGVKLPALSGTP